MTGGAVALGVVDVHATLTSYGLAGLAVVIFAETALLAGVVLPGETLLVVAGALSNPTVSPPPFTLPVVIGTAAVAAAAGGQVGFWIGRRSGPALFHRPDARVFRRSFAQRAESYFDRYGARTVVLARFIPIVRTFAAPAAGVGRMRTARFVRYNVAGAVLWAAVIAGAGHGLAELVPVDRYLLELTAVVAAVSLLPLIVQAARAWRRRQRQPAPESP